MTFTTFYLSTDLFWWEVMLRNSFDYRDFRQDRGSVNTDPKHWVHQQYNWSIFPRSPEPEPEDPARGEDQAGECGAQGWGHGSQRPAPQVGSLQG